MSLVALKFVFAALFAMLLIGLMWLVAELRQAPAGVNRLAKWIAVAVAVLAFAAFAVFAAPVVGGLLWWSFG